MSISADLSACVVAVAGEVIVCPDCGAGLATFRYDTTAEHWTGGATRPADAVFQKLPAGRFACNRWGGTVLECECGGAPTRPFAQAEGDRLPAANGPRIFIRRDGHPPAWRMLGGE